MIKYVIAKPVVVIVGIILISLFGILSLYRIPYQLTPSVTRPVITISTTWSGATPYEMEREIVERQEKALKGLDNLISMESRMRNSSANITLEFKIGTSLTESMLKVSNKLDEVKRYPDGIDKPIITATGESASPVVWMVLKTQDGNPSHVSQYRTFFNESVIQYFERIDGVAEVFFPGNTNREMHVIIDHAKLASYNLTLSDLIGVLDSENVNISAGTMDYGRRSYRVRSVAEYKSAEQISNTVIWSDGQKRVKLSDIGEVKEGYARATSYVESNFDAAMVIGIKPEPGANILELSDATERVFNELNSGILHHEGLYLEWVHDQRGYINGAISLVQQNIIIGGFLAIIVLWVFLRSFSSTVVIALAMPISILGTFIVMYALGRTLNVVSMAGISFAVGMLVDSAIVVLENIDRHRKLGKGIFLASFDGTREVVGALIASVLTTVAIFIPIINMEEEAGQLFRDIALTASSAVLFSMLVSIFVIPMFSYQILRFFGKKRDHAPTELERFGTRIVALIMSILEACISSRLRRIFTIVVFTISSILIGYLLMPKMEYLPQGNQNFVTTMINPPPGLSYEARREIGRAVFDLNAQYFLQNGYTKDVAGEMPPIRQMFFLGGDTFMYFGARSSIEDRAGDMIPQFFKTLAQIPGITGVSMQPGIFERGLGKGRTIDIDISGSDINGIIATASALQNMIRQNFPSGTQVRPLPSLDLIYPEINLYPDSDKLKAAGLTPTSFGIALDVLMEGRTIAEYKEEGREKIDLILKANKSDLVTPEEIYNAQIYTPNAGILPISSLSNIAREYGISEIRHFERKRTITLQVTPPKDTPLQSAMERIEGEFSTALKEQGLMNGISLRLSGTADKLTQTRLALQGGFLLAVVIIYLLMSALYENFIYPLIIIFTIPLAVAGGMLALKLVNLLLVSQPLDILTMLGFIILVGTVVNNAILIVYQAINNIRESGLDSYLAVKEAVRTRLRPIYMSTLTSLFGMLPLVVAPGPGSEVYRGLGAVILGGLTYSTIITVFVIPSLLLFVIDREYKQIDIENAERDGM
ncbi:MAG: efflux RND transporter permease subunit [Wolinella sp.]